MTAPPSNGPTLGDLTAADIGRNVTVRDWTGCLARVEHYQGPVVRWTTVLLTHVARPSGNSAYVSEPSDTPIQRSTP